MTFSSDGLKARAAGLRQKAERALKDARTRGQAAADSPPVAGPPRPGLIASVRRIVENGTAAVRLQFELASLEVKRKTKALIWAALFGIGALFFAFFGLLFAFATIAAGLATFLSWWLALLIVTAVLLGLTGLMVAFAIRRLKNGASPVPKTAISEAKLTAGALKR